MPNATAQKGNVSRQHPLWQGSAGGDTANPFESIQK